MDLGMRSTSHYDSMPCMTVASLEMSDEPLKCPYRNQPCNKGSFQCFHSIPFFFGNDRQAYHFISIICLPSAGISPDFSRIQTKAGFLLS